MTNPYVWPYYLPQQHPYLQFPPSANTSSGYPGPGHRHSRSWQGSPHMSPPVLPTLLPVVAGPPQLVSPVYQPALLHPGYPQTRDRRHSFDASSYVPVQPAPAAAPWPAAPAPYYTYSPGWTYAPVELPQPQLHNLLNGEIISQHLHINLVSPDLVFRRRTGPNADQLVTLRGYELEQPATSPQMTRVRVVCDAIPQWPVDLQVVGTTLTPHRRRRASLPFLTLEDIVHAVHASLHRKISHEEWGRLTIEQETEVARAYTRRFKASGNARTEREQQAEGVKRIDFLLKNTWFKGFTWLEPENGVERLKLLVGKEW
ncbi:hypothetical protein BC834DRAFT_897011 [Gloeopeniophorella convolvens]|nr:hypothetical protein BC834DRAFT_897011 [Gloeopeniophorella convolvens]